MKVTVVPAQITTVEDRIAGNLSLSQMLLLIAPVFGSSAIYILLPPNMQSATYKLVAMTILLAICCVLAIRIKGKVLLFWLIVRARYNLRPRYYIFNKNSQTLRDVPKSMHDTEPALQPDAKPAERRVRTPALSLAEIVHVESIMSSPNTHLAFETTKKGAFRVVITETKDQSQLAPAD